MVSQGTVAEPPVAEAQQISLQPSRPPEMEGGWWTWPSGKQTTPVTGIPAGTKMTPEQADRLKRRIARLRKGGMFDSQGSAATIERAVTIEDLTEAYALVHRVYVEAGYMTPSHGGVRIRAFEAFPEMATFVAKVDGKIVAVTSLVADSPDMGLPSDHVYREELDRLRQEPGTVFEVTNLAVDPEYRNRPLFIQVTQAVFGHAWANGCGNLFISVSPGHTHFFHDVCQFESCGSRRSYSDEVEDIVEGMRLCMVGCDDVYREVDRLLGSDDAFLYDLYFGKNPHYARLRDWAAQADKTFANPRMLRDLFILRSRFLLDCTDAELDAVNRRWGDRIWWQVWGEDEAPALRRPSVVFGRPAATASAAGSALANKPRTGLREAFGPARFPAVREACSTVLGGLSTVLSRIRGAPNTVPRQA